MKEQTARIQVCLPKELYEKLKNHAKASYLTYSEYIRLAITDKIKKDKKK